MVANERKILRCAVYTRKSSEHGLEQVFNSLDAQREAAEAYIKSQAHEGWKLIKTQYNDGGFSGGTLQRPALQSLLGDIRARKIDVVVVYKVDRLTRSLADFAKLVELFEAVMDDNSINRALDQFTCLCAPGHGCAGCDRANSLTPPRLRNALSSAMPTSAGF